MGNKIIYNIKILKSNLCDYKDAYIFLRSNITVTAAPATQVAFKIVHHLQNALQKLMKQQ